MDQQQQQQLDQQLRQNWQRIRYEILDNFSQVSTADVDAARNVDDLVQRIADRSHHSEGFVENRLLELVGATAQGGAQAGQQGQAFGQQAGQGQAQTYGQQPGQAQTGQQGQPFGSGRQ